MKEVGLFVQPEKVENITVSSLGNGEAKGAEKAPEAEPKKEVKKSTVKKK